MSLCWWTRLEYKIYYLAWVAPNCCFGLNINTSQVKLVPLTFKAAVVAMLPVIAAVLVGALLSYYLIFRKVSGPPLPPGPKPLPTVGNVLDLPPKGVPEYQHWLTFKDKYGPLAR